MGISKNFNLSARKESVREKKTIEIKEFEINDILTQFNENIEWIKTQFNIANDLEKDNKIEECKNIWRSQIVFLESALDYYIHCISKYGMMKIFKGEWEKTEKYNNFQITLKEVDIFLKNSENSSEFFKLINDKFANDTFMSYESIKNQLNLIGIKPKEIAKDVYYEQGSTEKDFNKFKRILNQLFNRRNCIVHQFDRYHESGERQEITYNEVSEGIDNICKIVNSIHSHIEEKNNQ